MVGGMLIAVIVLALMGLFSAASSLRTRLHCTIFYQLSVGHIS